MDLDQYYKQFTCIRQMRENNRKSLTQISPSLEIPHLNIPQIQLDDPKIRYKPTKEPLNFLKVAPLDHHQQFLKEKSLYRYSISRKLSRTSLNMSQTCLIQNVCLQPNKSEKSIETNIQNPQKIENKEHSIYSQSTNGGPKVRHFKRRNKTDLNQNSFQSSKKETFEPVIKQERPNSRQRIYSQKQNNNNSDKEIKSIRIQNYQLKRELLLLKEQKNKANKQSEGKDQVIYNLHLDNDKLLKQMKKINPIHSDRFINENKLQNELLVRGHLINELQEKIKYLELENSILKKSKKQKEQQAGTIQRLQLKNKTLQTRLKVVTALRTKRNRLKNSMMSSCSEISLDLSADAEDDDFGKFYDALRTTQRTQQKHDTVEITSQIIERQLDEEQSLLLPLWSLKLRT